MEGEEGRGEVFGDLAGVRTLLLVVPFIGRGGGGCTLVLDRVDVKVEESRREGAISESCSHRW